MNEDTLNILKEPSVIIITTVTSIIILYFKIYFAKLFEDREKKNLRDIWIRFFSKYDANIRECRIQFKNIEEPNDNCTIFSQFAGLISGYLGIFILFSITLKYVANVDIIAMSISLYFFVILILTTIVYNYIDTIIKSNNLSEKSKWSLYSLTVINFNIFISSFVSAVFMYLIYLNSDNISNSDLIKMSIMLIVAFSFLILTMLFTNVSRRNLLNHSKNLLNNNFFDDFPFVHIKTTSLDFQGKICDVFNENLIILDDNGVKKTAEWHSISYLELGEKHSDNTNMYDRI